MKNFILLFLLIFVLFIPWFVFAEEVDCPFGFINDPAPGSCARYIDMDANSLCDLSEVPTETNVMIDIKKDIAYLSEAELKEKTVKEVAEVYGIETSAYRAALSEFLDKDVKGGDSLLDLHDNDGLCSGVAANIALGLKNQGTNVRHDIEQEPSLPSENQVLPRYRILPISVTLLFLYLITYILVLQKKMKVLTMRRIWNVVLLFSFLISVLLGVLLIIRINWGIIISLPFNMLYWHVEAGTVMAVVTIFHLTWYWRFYTCMLKRKNKEECNK
jgi:hypothetical protein